MLFGFVSAFRKGVVSGILCKIRRYFVIVEERIVIIFKGNVCSVSE